MSKLEHWQQVYSNQASDQLGWYTPCLNTSIRWIEDLGLNPASPIIDVGGGAATLVDDLLDKGHSELSVLDLSESALSVVQQRLGKRADSVSWLQGDITRIKLPFEYYGLWHDRAVFHFLVDPRQQQRYRDQLVKALQAEGYFMIGVFDIEGPAQCSGLPVQRYDVEGLQSVFGAEFELIQHQRETHETPSGMNQQYLYCLFRKHSL